MLVGSVDWLLVELRETKLLRAEQYRLLMTEMAARFEDAEDLAKHLVAQGWITSYQADELLSGRGPELLLGPYVILDTIGEGGMGKVFKAKQLRLNRLVALKVVHPDLINNEMALKRFQRESTAAAQLCHPNIVRLYDADQAGDRHFLVMEYVSGVDLSDRVHDVGCLPVEAACSYIRQAATGLQHAHDVGIVHRDIKPGNLLLTLPNPAAKTAGDVIKILDMGLARIGSGMDDQSLLTNLTQEGAVIGTPDYMSPEQAKNGSDVDARSDLYSLGCTLYFLLTGRPPFRQGSTLERLMQHQLDAPPPIHLFRPDLPKEVATIVHILLAKRPEDRFQSGMALADALEPWCVVDKRAHKLPTVKSVFPDKVPEPTPMSDVGDLESIVAKLMVTERDGDGPNAVERTSGEPKVAEPNADKPTDNAAVPQTEPKPTPVSVKSEAGTPRRTNRKRFAWLAAIFVGVASIVVGINAASKAVNKPGATPPAPEQTRDQPRPQPRADKEPPSITRKAVNEPLDAFLPADTEFIAIINVQQLAKSKSFADQVKPKFETELKTLYSAALFDPLKSVDLVIVAVPALSDRQAVIVVQGKDFLTSDLLNWVGMLPGVQITPSKVPGQGMKDIYRLTRDKEKGEADLFGAILSINPSRVVLSASKERVIEALARVGQETETRFDDPTIKTMLARYDDRSIGKASVSPPAVWMALGTRGRRIGFGNAMHGGPQSIMGTLRLEHGMELVVTLEAANRTEAVAAWSQITQFAREAIANNSSDKRVERIATLVLQAMPNRLPDAPTGPTFVGQWSAQIEFEKLSEWFTPFFESP